MANRTDSRVDLQLNSRHLTRAGAPWIPISGEIHYSRVPRHRWAERIRQMQAGGITVISFYVPWLHHVAERGMPRFDGNLDVGAFIDEVRAVGLDVVLRLGPWVHGEMRNGGLPDWVLNAPVTHRTNDPGYLELVAEWFAQVGAALDGRGNPETVLGIQIENELYDQPDHIARLKEIARESGISAPLWTATAWGGAQLPDPEVLPLYGGYGDGFWVDQDRPWDDSFREHYFFSHVWDDPGIGADVRGEIVDTATSGLSSAWFPAATCEIGGGMATAYHRRPWPSALDVAAVSHCKLGNGSAWQGLYMYTGGTNPGMNLQESHASGYPNDMVELSYDFHSPIGEAGNLAESHAAFRRQHFFIQAMGDVLATLPSHLPDIRPAGVDDTETLRWAFRGDGDGGFLYIAWHQPHLPLPTYRDAQFQVVLDQESITLPSHPIDIEAGTLANWPVGLHLGGVRLAWATASVFTLLDGPVPTLVLIAEHGIPAELAVDTSHRLSAEHVATVGGRLVATVEPGFTPTRVTNGPAEIDVLVLPAHVAGSVWVQANAAGHPHRVFISDDELRWTTAATVEVLSTRLAPDVRVYDPATLAFTTLALETTARPAVEGPVAVTTVRDATPGAPGFYGEADGRLSAPSAQFCADNAAVFDLLLPEWAATGDSFLEIRWAGDVGKLLVDGRIVSDRFWDGSPWFVNLVDAGYTAQSIVQLLVLPLAGDSPIALPQAAAERLAASRSLVAVDSIRAVRPSAWQESTD